MCPAPCSLTGGWWKRQAAGFPLAGPAADSRRLGEWAGPDRSGRNGAACPERTSISARVLCASLGYVRVEGLLHDESASSVGRPRAFDPLAIKGSRAHELPPGAFRRCSRDGLRRRGRLRRCGC